MLRSICVGSVERRAAQWLERLRLVNTASVPVEFLYAGDHWSIVKAINSGSAAGGYRVRVWVCSAGYGLIGFKSKVGPYSATFSASHPDSVCQNVLASEPREVPQGWWRSLGKWVGPDKGAPRSL